MNLIEHTVTEVTSEPYFNDMWCVKVIATSRGNKQPTTLCRKTRKEVEAITVGYIFDA